MTQQEGFSDNLKQWLTNAKGAATSDTTLTLSSLAAAAIFGTAVITTPTDAAAWGQVLDALKNVGLGIVANALPSAVGRIGKRQGKVTLKALAQELDEQAATNQQFREQLDGFVQQLLAGDATLLRDVRELHDSMVNFGDRHDEKLDRLASQMQQLLDRATQQISQTTISTAGGSNISGSNTFSALVQTFGANNQIIIITNGYKEVIDEAEQRELLAEYYQQLQQQYGRIPLLQNRPDSYIPMHNAYLQLQAAERLADLDRTRHELAAELGKLVQEWRKQKQLSENEIESRRAEFDFHYRAGLRLQTERLNLHQAVVNYPRLVILGEPGSGKTTLLRYLAYALSVDQPTLSGVGAVWMRVPLFVQLTKLAKFDIDSLLDAAIPANLVSEPERLKRVLREYLKQGGCLLLLDGLDEVPVERRVELAKFINNINCSPPAPSTKPQRVLLTEARTGNRLIVTCRVASYELAPLATNHAHYTVLGLAVEQQREFLHHCFAAASDGEAEGWADAQAEALSHALQPVSLQRLAQVPLLLALTAYIWRSRKGQLPSTRAGLYHEAVQLLLQWRGEQKLHQPDALNPAEVYAKVGRLAYCLLLNRSRGTFLKVEAQPFVGDLWKRLWQEEGGLFVVRGADDRPTTAAKSLTEDDYWFGFPHLSFTEYFAGCYLAGSDIADKEQRLAVARERIRRHRHDSRFQEAVLLGLGYLQAINPSPPAGEASIAGKLLYDICLDPQREHKPEYEDLFHRDLLLAMRACADGILPPQATLDSLLDEAVSLWVDEDTGRGRYELLREQLGSMFDGLAGGEAGKQLAGRLLARLNDDDRWVRRLAVDALASRAGSDEAVRQRLVHLLTSEGDRDVLAALIGTLLKLPTSEQQPLRERLYNIVMSPPSGLFDQAPDTACRTLYTSVTESSLVASDEVLCLPIQSTSR